MLGSVIRTLGHVTCKGESPQQGFTLLPKENLSVWVRNFATSLDSNQMTNLVTLFEHPAEVQYRAAIQFTRICCLNELPVLHEYGHHVCSLQRDFQRHQRKFVV